MIWVLVVTTIITLLALGVAQLVTTRFNTEEQLRGYSRAYYIAEAAANWQLARMSRIDPTGTLGSPWLKPSDVDPTQTYQKYAVNGFYTLNNIDPGTKIDGNVYIKLTGVNSNSTQPWTLPNQFLLTVRAQDPVSGVERGLFLKGQPTGLADRYSLYGANGITFNGNANGVCTLSNRMIGTDGTLANTSSASPPIVPTFACCLLGPHANVVSAPWLSTWDLPLLTAPVRWPLIDDVARYVWSGATVQSLSAPTQNDNIQISYLDSNGNYNPFASPPTKLTDAEFKLSTSVNRTIRLKVANPASNHHNLFYFTDIQMKPTDVLALDLTTDNNGTMLPTAIRIVIDSPTLTIQAEPTMLITNLAYNTAQNMPSMPHPYLWFNNTNRPFEYSPRLPSGTVVPAGQVTVYSNLLGLVYGINAQLSGNNTAGDIIIDGNNSIPITVDCLVGNHITIGPTNGPVTVTGQSYFEQGGDPNMYVLYYRIAETLAETDGSDAPKDPRPPVIDYGQFQ